MPIVALDRSLVRRIVLGLHHRLEVPRQLADVVECDAEQARTEDSIGRQTVRDATAMRSMDRRGPLSGHTRRRRRPSRVPSTTVLLGLCRGLSSWRGRRGGARFLQPREVVAMDGDDPWSHLFEGLESVTFTQETRQRLDGIASDRLDVVIQFDRVGYERDEVAPERRLGSTGSKTNPVGSRSTLGAWITRLRGILSRASASLYFGGSSP